MHVMMVFFQRMSISSMPSYEIDLKKALETLERSGAKAPRQRAKSLSRAAFLLSLDPVRRPTSFALFEEAEHLAKYYAYERIIVTNQIRYGIALQFSGRHSDAIRMFDSALNLIRLRRMRKIRDYALQHKGKCLAEMEAYDQAVVCFLEALRLRRRRGEADLIRSTEEAILGTKKLIHQVEFSADDSDDY